MPGEARIELPHRIVPLLVLCMDQCQTQLAGVNFCIHSLSMFAMILEDLYHREWNDCKNVAKSIPIFWKCILQLKALDLVILPAFGVLSLSFCDQPCLAECFDFRCFHPRVWLARYQDIRRSEVGAYLFLLILEFCEYMVLAPLRQL